MPRLLSFFLLLFIAIFGASGCVSYRYVAVENKYQKSSLPLHFDRNQSEDKRSVSTGFKKYRKERIEFWNPYTMNVDSSGRSYDTPPPGWVSHPVTLEGYHLVENAPYGIELTYLREMDLFYFGISGGLSVADIHHYGFFWGVSRKFGNLIPGFSVGLYRNWVKAYLNYWSKSNSHTDLYGTWTYAGTEVSRIPRWDVATRVGILYDRGNNFSPYAGYSNNQISLSGSLRATVHEICLGMAYPLPRQYSLSTEVSHTSSRVEGYRQDNLGNLQIRLAKEF